MLNKVLFTAVLGICASCVSAANENLVRLVETLDESKVYCLDLSGFGENTNLDNPLQAHTCKDLGEQDQTFSLQDGKITVPGSDRCLQFSGAGGKTLPGSAILVRACAEDNRLQQVDFEANGLLKLRGTDYCIAAGPDSTPARGAGHMWRTLIVANCDESDARFRWQLSS